MKTIIKRKVIILLCMLISVITFGQEKKQFSDEIKGVKVSPPRFLGNEELLSVLNAAQFVSLNDYLKSNIQYPENSKKWQEEGTEVIQFVVTPKGEVTNFNVINSVSPEITQEVLRVLKTTNGLWKPGLNDGKPVAMEKEVSVAFKSNIGFKGVDYSTNFVDQAKWYFDKGNKKFFTNESNKSNQSALKYYDKAIRYLPNDKALLVTRGMCRYELGDKSGACQDWNRIKTLGGIEGDAYLGNFCEFKGYFEMISNIQGKE